MPNIRDIHVNDTSTANDTQQIMMYVNGQPVVTTPTPSEPISETDVMTLAEQVTGDASVAAEWMTRPNPRLQNRTPVQAIREGDSQKTADILRSFMIL